MEATNLPWSIERHGGVIYIVGSDDLQSVVAEIRMHEDAEANAELLIKAVNEMKQ